MMRSKEGKVNNHGRRMLIFRCLPLIICFTLSACSHRKTEEKTEETETVELRYDLTDKAKAYADSLISVMTLEEKAGQCLMPAIFSSHDPSTVSLLRKYIGDYHVGGIVLLKGNLEAVRELAGIGLESQIPLFIAIDAEWGLGMRLEDAPVYPKNGNISKDVDESELYDYGRKIAGECREAGINMVLGPVVDVVEGTEGIIGNRSFGENPELVSDYGIAYAKGLESGGVISVAKHFPGHGSTVIDSHKGVAKISRSITDLDSLDLKPFKDYSNEGLSAIMAGHIESRALDPDGTPASVSMDMLTSLLREEMGFKGLVITDAFTMGGAKGFSAAEALKAGADIVLSPLNVEKDFLNLLESVKTGEMDEAVLEDRCRRILFYKALFLLPE